mmetsp:Transcript_1850/g.2433  ORF Transcript_1850/g.2433 Transcript_1850/m.2433 type:complete len:89 (-) Transcript_1850:30-296(-)
MSRNRKQPSKGGFKNNVTLAEQDPAIDENDNLMYEKHSNIPERTLWLTCGACGHENQGDNGKASSWNKWISDKVKLNYEFSGKIGYFS